MTDDVIPTPEGNIAGRKLHFFWLADCSWSMRGRRMEVLNQAIRDVIPNLREAMRQHPEVQMLMRAISFSHDAKWHVGPEPIPLEDFHWDPLSPDGFTATAKAIRLLATELNLERMPQRKGLPPVCILISDGECTEKKSEYEAAITELESTQWGRKAIRLAIAIGDESEYNEEELLRFVSHKEVGVLKAHTAAQLLDYITWGTIEASIASSQSRMAAQVATDPNLSVNLRPPPPASRPKDSDSF